MGAWGRISAKACAIWYTDPVRAAGKMERALAGVISEGKRVTYDLSPKSPVGTAAMADAVIERLRGA